MSRWIAPLLAGTLLGAVVGGAIVFVSLGDGASDSGPMTVAAKSSAAASDPEEHHATAPALAESSGPVDAERSAGALGTTNAPPELLDKVATITKRAPPSGRRGDKTIRGRVTDARAHPLAGVLVRALRESDDAPQKVEPNAAGGAPPPAPSLDDVVRTAIEDYYAKHGEYREATSDADGRYVLADLRVGRFSVQAWKEGLRFQPQNGGEWVRPDATVDFVGKPVVLLPIDVRMPGGDAATAAYVWASMRGRGDTEATGWSPEKPTLPLAPGDYEVQATLGDPNSGPPWPEFLSAEKQKVTVVDGEKPPTVRLELKGEPGIRGHVTKADGSIGRAQVRVATPASGVADDKRLAEDPDAKSAWTENGEFLFRDLKPGRYLLGVSRDWRNKFLVHDVVEVANGMVVHDFVLPELDAASCVIARVTGPDGDPVSEANFQWRVERDKNGSAQNDANAERKEPGTWWLPIDSVGANDFDPLKPWPPQTRLFLLTWSEAFGSTVLEVFQATRSVEVHFGPPATLLVTVPGFVEGDYQGRLRLQLDRAGEGIQKYAWGGGAEPSKDDGVAKIGPVEAGRYKLTLWLGEKNQRWQQCEVSSMELSIAAGESHVTMSIPQLYSLVVRMSDGSDGRLNLQAVGKANQRSRYGEVKDGAATFNDIPAGDWRLTCSGGSNPGVMLLSVPTGGPIDYAPMAVTAARVIILDGAGLLATTGFQDGDLVTAIAGKEITSFLDLQLLQAAARVSKNLALTVQRGTQKVDLTLESRFLNDYGRLGGSLEPAVR